MIQLAMKTLPQSVYGPVACGIGIWYYRHHRYHIQCITYTERPPAARKVRSWVTRHKKTEKNKKR